MSYRQIALHLNIPLNTVKDTIQKGYQEGQERKGRGRYPKTTKLQDNSMVEEALINRNTSYSEIAKKSCSQCLYYDSEEKTSTKASEKVVGTEEGSFE